MARYNAGAIPASPTVVSGVTAFGTHVNPFIAAALSGFSGTTRSDSATAGHIFAKQISGGYEPSVFVGSSTDIPMGEIITADGLWRVPIESIRDALLNSGLGAQPGMTGWFAGATAPAGWLVRNGAAVSRTTYAALFAAIGTTWGAGNGSTTFNLPDARNRSPIGSGTRSVGTTGGAETHTLTQNEMPTHVHRPEGDVGSWLRAGVGGGTIAGLDEGPFFGPGISSVNNTQPTGGGASHNNMHPFLVELPIIKF